MTDLVDKYRRRPQRKGHHHQLRFQLCAVWIMLEPNRMEFGTAADYYCLKKAAVVVILTPMKKGKSWKSMNPIFVGRFSFLNIDMAKIKMNILHHISVVVAVIHTAIEQKNAASSLIFTNFSFYVFYPRKT